MKKMRKVLIVLLVFVLMVIAVSCDDGNKTPSKWDGSIDSSWYDKSKDEFTLTQASQLAGLAKLVNDGDTFSGKTIILGSDINLNSQQWTPIGLYKNTDGQDNKKPFSGTFDGKDHVITGLRIDCDEGKSSYRALFGYANGEIKNFTVEGKIVACDASGVVAALGDGGVIDNVVNKVDVSVTKPIENTDHDHAKVAGLVVAVKDGEKGCKIQNCTNYGTIESKTSKTDDAIGGIVAWSKHRSLTIDNCKNKGNVSTTSTLQHAGGIIGCVEESATSTTIKKCENTGTISSGIDDGTGTGAIIGWIYAGTNVKIKDCTPTEGQIGKDARSTN